MRVSILIFCSVLVSLFMACGIPMGNRINTQNLQVYYIGGVTKEKAIDFTTYWKSNGFIHNSEQVIQLEVTAENVMLVKLIEKEQYHQTALSIEEQALLSELQRTLEKEVFQQPTEIVITDNTFRPLEKE